MVPANLPIAVDQLAIPTTKPVEWRLASPARLSITAIKSGTGPRFFLLALEAVIGYNDNDRERKRLCVVLKLWGLKLLAF
jgi:hypothetical protein